MMPRISHVYIDFAPHLVRDMAKRYATEVVPDGVVYLFDKCYWPSRAVALEKNGEWLKDLPQSVWGGYLTRSCWLRVKRIGSGHIRNALSIFFPECSFISLIRLLRGPRDVLVHGFFLSLGTMIFLRLMGKRVSLVHWGGDPRLSGCRMAVFKRLACRLMNHIFVLMSPEVQYFKSVDRGNVTTQSYLASYSKLVEKGRQETTVDYSHARVLIGNSCWSLSGYVDLLSHIKSGSWREIICMLNYGMENSPERVESFVRRHKEKYGTSFIPWRTVLPYEEYLRYMQESPYYICPAGHQTGLGAIYHGIVFGKTLFLRGDNLAWMRAIGVKAYNIDDFQDFSFETVKKLRLSEQEIASNRKALGSYFLLSNARWASEIIRGFL